MEELTEVITAAEFHPHQCNVFVYSSSKGTIRLCDMRSSALCDRHAKCKYPRNTLVFQKLAVCTDRRRPCPLQAWSMRRLHVDHANKEVLHQLSSA